MALVVDAAGNRTTQAKPAGIRRGNGALDLISALGNPVPKADDDTLSDVLARNAIGEVGAQSSRPQRQWQDTVMASPAPGTASYGGVPQYVQSETPSRVSTNEDWERNDATRVGRTRRTSNVFGEDYDVESGMVGNTPQNDAYGRMFMDEGLSKDDLYDMTHRQMDVDFEQNKSSPTDLIGVKTRNEHPVYTFDKLDDGTLDADHLMSDMMTGTQYLKYSQLGMGGRPVEEIDPSWTYSKSVERDDYGFTPWTPNDTARLNQDIANVVQSPSRLTGAIREARTQGVPFLNDVIEPTDYTINVGDKSVSGREYDRKAAPYLHQYDYYSRFDPMRYVTMPEDMDGYTAIVNEYQIPDVSGEMTYHYGVPEKVESDIIRVATEDGEFLVNYYDVPLDTLNIDGVRTIDGGEASGTINDYEFDDDYKTTTFSDGSRVTTPSGFDIGKSVVRTDTRDALGQLPDLASMNDIDEMQRLWDESGENPIESASVVFVPDMMMDDGTSLSFDDVSRMYNDREPEDNPDTSEDDDITYEFGPANVPLVGYTPIGLAGRVFDPLRLDNRPARLMQQEMFKDGEWRLEDVGNNLYDWAAGSAAISARPKIPVVKKILPLDWLGSLSSSAQSARGVDPMSYNSASDAYGQLVLGGYDDDGNLRYGIDSNGDEVPDAGTRKWFNALGSAIVPATESLAGNVSSDPLREIVESALGRSLLPSNPTLWQVLGNAGFDMLGEALEEEVGNPVENVTQFGESAYGDPLLDENGEPVVDLYGTETLDMGTSPQRRIENALDVDEAVNAALGGAGVSLFMNPMLLPNAIASGRRDIQRMRMGIDPFVSPSDVMEVEEGLQPRRYNRKRVSRDYANQFSDETRE